MGGVSGGRRTLFCALVLAAAVFAVFLARLEASRGATACNNCVLGADVRDYREALDQGLYGGLKLRKHALAVASVATIAWPLAHVGVPRPLAGSIALALIEAIGAAALFAFLRRNFLDDGAALALAGLFLASFSTVTLLSVPETYGVTIAAAAAGLLAFGELARGAARHPVRNAVAAGLVGALAGWANLPAAAFALGYTGLVWRHLPGSLSTRIVRAAVIPLALAVAVALLPAVLLDAKQGFAWQSDYVESYADLGNFVDPAIVTDFVLAFFVFPFVAPVDHVLCRYAVADLDLTLAAVPRVASWLVVALVLAAGFVRGARSADRRPFVLAMAAVVASLFGFYLFFNPDEALLYSPQWVLALFAGAAAGLGATRWTAASVVALVLCLGLNLAPLDAAQTRDPARCCPSPPRTEGPIACPVPASFAISAVAAMTPTN